MTSSKEKACNCDPLWQHDGEKVTLLHATYCASNPKTEEKVRFFGNNIREAIGTIKEAYGHHEHGTEGWEEELQDLLESAGSGAVVDLKSFIASLILKAKEEGRKEGNSGRRMYELGKKEGYQKRDKEVDVSAVFGFDAGVKSERERILAVLPTLIKSEWIELENESRRNHLYTAWTSALKAIRDAIEQAKE